MDNIQIFSNPQFGEIRTAVSKSGEPLFCLADVCRALDLTNPTVTKSRLRADGLSTTKVIDTLGRQQPATFINEPNLYKCIFQSRKAEAEKFQDWVCEEVLPSIRKHGVYATPQTIDGMLADPDNAIKLFQSLKEERQLRMAAENKVNKLQPLADFANTAFRSDTLISISQAAKILKLGFGRNTLFKKLREKGVFFTAKNEPKQKFIDAKYFELVEGKPIPRSDGSTFIPVTVYCTQKGLAYINHLFGGTRPTPQIAKIGDAKALPQPTDQPTDQTSTPISTSTSVSTPQNPQA